MRHWRILVHETASQMRQSFYHLGMNARRDSIQSRGNLSLGQPAYAPQSERGGTTRIVARYAQRVCDARFTLLAAAPVPSQICNDCAKAGLCLGWWKTLAAHRNQLSCTSFSASVRLSTIRLAIAIKRSQSSIKPSKPAGQVRATFTKSTLDEWLEEFVFWQILKTVRCFSAMKQALAPARSVRFGSINVSECADTGLIPKNS